MKLSNKRLVRLINLLQDRPFWKKRWYRRQTTIIVPNDSDSLTTREYKDILTKEEDPNWRLNQPWVVFSFPHIESYYPVYMEDNNADCYMQLFIPVTTPLFAMRVSSKSFRVSVCGADIFTIFITPEIIAGEEKPLSKNEVIKLSEDMGKSVRFI